MTAPHIDFCRQGGFTLLPLTLWLTAWQSSRATSVSFDELNQAQRWVTAKFAGVQERPLLPAGLVVLANNDPVQRNGRAGKPMKIVDAEYRRGLYCHAVSKVIVRLPGPGRTFSAVIGVDTNSQTSGGRGSVVFSVDVAGKRTLGSQLMREGMPGAPIRVDLDGAKEFVLNVGDGGDGIACDQADWADAEVVLANGETVWLGDLPLVDASVPPYSIDPPFSFVYDGTPSSELLENWDVTRDTRKLDERRTEHVATYADPRSGLVVRCVGIQYHDFPTVEWTVHFRNTGTQATPILSDILALDTRLHRTPGAEFVLHHHTGSPCLPEDYRPFATELAPEAGKRITAAGGRPTNSDLPYFNAAWLDEGVIVAVGWPGQWAAEFIRDEAHGLRIRAGQELTHLRLHAGEEIRTPLVVLQFWNGDRVRSQNIWRRWMLAHNLPRHGGRLPQVQMSACSSHQFGEMIHADSASQKLFRRGESFYEAARLPLRGLGPDNRYELTDLDRPGSIEATGRELTEEGLLVSIPERPGSVVVVYKKAE